MASSEIGPDPGRERYRPRADVRFVAQVALYEAERLVPLWLSDGKRQGPEWVAEAQPKNHGSKDAALERLNLNALARPKLSLKKKGVSHD